MAHLKGVDAPDLSQCRPVTRDPPRDQSYAEADMNPAQSTPAASLRRSSSATSLSKLHSMAQSSWEIPARWAEAIGLNICVLRVCCLAAHPVAVVSSFNHASRASDQHLLLTVGGDEL
ncbi:hypothetical protein PtA15_1A651 [Puccinia triticina]|uniref:Uncharacterized protein n=1 Tax=Puccinia triticina TaxID=208348 RepID=A0ABY7CAX1_9BASI|nr:uncharacterized protein PtA15_1A651 [Puccinia triticina]WAQ81311.1 hypothetical protein PtA15_1A651 [Puccinia triticina]